jgi:hypothetical protein
MKINIINIG